MTTIETRQSDTTQQGAPLDPADWEDFRRQGYAAVDALVRHLGDRRSEPVWQPVPPAVRDSFATPLPEDGIGADAALSEVERDVLPYGWGNSHPRFWGWVNGSAVPVAVLADLLTSGLDPNAGAFEQAATYVEDQVLDWLKELLGFERGFDGLLTSGCSMSNLLALGAMRSDRAGFDVRQRGMAAADRPLVVYSSPEAHASNDKALEVLGFGSENVRKLELDPEELNRKIQVDRERGFHPVCVVASAGTVNTGAIDDLDGIADVCKREGLWLHVDGAFGALAWMAPSVRPSLRGMHRADSVAFDLHKWLLMPNDVGGVFVRDGAALKRAFEMQADYLTSLRGGPTSNPRRFADLGIELTRRFRALKVWTALRAHGAKAFREVVERNLRQAQLLSALVKASRGLELAAEVPLNVINFRYIGDVPDSDQDALNEELLVRIQESGLAMPSFTRIDGRSVLRVAITNHRSTDEDFALLVDAAQTTGDELADELRAEAATWRQA